MKSTANKMARLRDYAPTSFFIAALAAGGCVTNHQANPNPFTEQDRKMYEQLKIHNVLWGPLKILSDLPLFL